MTQYKLTEKFVLDCASSKDERINPRIYTTRSGYRCGSVLPHQGYETMFTLDFIDFDKAHLDINSDLVPYLTDLIELAEGGKYSLYPKGVTA